MTIYITLGIPVVSSLLFTHFFNVNVGNSYGFFPTIVWVYYFIENRKEAFITSFLLLICCLAFQYYEQLYVPNAPAIVMVVSYFPSLIVLFIMMKLITDEIDGYRADLIDKQADLETVNQQMEQKNEQLATLNSQLQEAVSAEQKTSIDLEMSNARLINMQNHLVQVEKTNSSARLMRGTVEQLSNPLNFVFAGVNAIIDGEQEVSEVLSEYRKLHKLKEEGERQGKLEEIRAMEQEMDFDESLDDRKGIIGDTEKGISQVDELLHLLTLFTEQISPVNLIPTNVAEIAREQIGLLTPKQQARIELKVDENLTEASVAQSAFASSLSHLIKNALESGDGKIVVKLWPMGKRWAVSVKDTGKGMSDKVKGRATEPFYTTKKPPHKGVGLSIVSHVVLQHDGILEIDSTKNKGTTIFLSMPN